MRERVVSKKVMGVLLAVLLAVLTLSPQGMQKNSIFSVTEVSAATIPEYTGQIYTTVNDNIPEFTAKQKKNTSAFEKYSKLDSLGRCGVAFANICTELMPTEKRGNISSIKPSGWVKNMGWQRCHLIGYQLSGENANKKNLITGTEYFNVSGMLPFENMVADYVKETGNHVLYRVTPMFKGKELVARGVQMEAWSVEDKGDGVCFNVFVFNVAKDKTINYKTGKVTSSSTTDKKTDTSTKTDTSLTTVYWTKNGTVYHSTKNCSTLKRSKTILSGTIAQSGKPRRCKRC
jgi:DNA-entry nuclease